MKNVLVRNSDYWHCHYLSVFHCFFFFFYIFMNFHISFLKRFTLSAIPLFTFAVIIFHHTQRATGKYPIQSTEYYVVSIPYVHVLVKDCWSTHLFKRWILFILLDYIATMLTMPLFSIEHFTFPLHFLLESNLLAIKYKHETEGICNSWENETLQMYANVLQGAV